MTRKMKLADRNRRNTGNPASNQRSSGSVVHKSISRGGRRPGSGAPRGNGNARKGVRLPDWLKLTSSEEVLDFMRKILVPYGLSGQLGSRQVSALTTICKVLLDYDRLEELEKRIEQLEKVKGN